MSSPPGAQAVIRAIRLLKTFAERQREWSLKELVDSSGLNKTTVFRLLSALESEGLLERSEQNHYRLGPEMIALGGWAIQHNDLLLTAEPILREFGASINERVTLEQPVINPDGSRSMLMLTQMKSSHLINIDQIYGTRLPIHATSTGKAYLAFLPEDEQWESLHGRLEEITPTTITQKKVLIQELVAIRQRGYATALGELEEGLMAAGAPIFDHTGRPVAAISVEGPESRIDESRLHALALQLIQTAKLISGRLGHRASDESMPLS